MRHLHLAIAFVLLLSPLARAAPAPNVVLVLVDDLGWTDLACFGSKYYETPNLDRLAAEGMRFTDAYAACAVCSPTRAAVMTGRYPARVGVTDWIRARFQGGKIPGPGQRRPVWQERSNKPLLCPVNPLWMERSEVTVAEWLKGHDYVSCHIGKWHLGPDDWYPQKQGFDENHGGCDYGQPPSYYDPYTNKRLKQGIPHLAPKTPGQYLTDREGDEAVSFIERHKDKRFFLFLANYAVHTPIQAHKGLVGKYQAKSSPTPQKNAAYASMVESVDVAVGRVMKKLEQLKLAENTLVIFTSDNGGLMGPTHNAPLRAGKGHPYEGGIRVPLIVRWPAVVKPGTVCAEPVTSVDYLPTIAEAVAGEVKSLGDQAIDGVSLMPLFASAGKGKLGRDGIYWHFPHYRGRIEPYSIVRAGDWKMLRHHESGREELYNLRADIGETKDLAAAEPQRVKALGAQLDAWFKHTGAKVPKRNPNYKKPKPKKK